MNSNISPDPIIEAVRGKLLQRSVVGLAKYGKTLEGNNLSEKEWLIHLQEELLDAAGYIQKLISLIEENE